MTGLRNVDGMPPRTQAKMLLSLVGGRATAGQCVEARWFARPRVDRHWWSIEDLDDMAARVVSLGSSWDIYVGAAPRLRHGGTAADVAPAWALWADLDDPQAVADLASYDTPPHLVVETSEGHAHAWWAIVDALEPRHLPRALRRLAHHLGADMVSTDAARIMRPPGTRNHKRGGERVELITFNPRPAIEIRTLVGALPDPAEPPHRTPTPPATSPRAAWDPLLDIASRHYVPYITGRPPRRDGKVRCPMHADGQERTPSLQLYDDPARGWFCFGCDRGGSIVDFGALLWGLEPRGRDYHEIRRRLAAELGITLQEAA
jgi:DNA primase RepB-like protein/CHC2-type zinc finger protein